MSDEIGLREFYIYKRPVGMRLNATPASEYRPQVRDAEGNSLYVYPALSEGDLQALLAAVSGELTAINLRMEAQRLAREKPDSFAFVGEAPAVDEDEALAARLRYLQTKLRALLTFLSGGHQGEGEDEQAKAD